MLHIFDKHVLVFLNFLFKVEPSFPYKSITKDEKS